MALLGRRPARAATVSCKHTASTLPGNLKRVSAIINAMPVPQRPPSPSLSGGTSSGGASPTVTPGSVVLAIDYGRRRMGLALSDELGMTARPLVTFTRVNRRRDLARLRELCRQHGVAKIVVGWPLKLDGTAGEMAEEASAFAERVRKNLGLSVELADERLSSWAAGEAIEEAAPRGRASRSQRATLDEVAAAVILRDYLSRTRSAAPRADRG